MLYKEFMAQAAIAALPVVINAYKEKGEDVSWPTFDVEKAEWQLPDKVARACYLYAERLANEMDRMGSSPSSVFFDPDRGQMLNDVERELAGIREAIEKQTEGSEEKINLRKIISQRKKW